MPCRTCLLLVFSIWAAATIGPWGSRQAGRAAEAPDEEGFGYASVTDELAPVNEGRIEWQVDDVTFMQPVPLLPPTLEYQPQSRLPAPASELSLSLFGPQGPERELISRIRARYPSISTDRVDGAESAFRVTSDAGSLLRKSLSAPGAGTQRRTPIVTDPRLRGSRVGSLAASGSYWIPARIDLDTPLSNLDSSLIDFVDVIEGPYSVQQGPGFRFLDVELMPTPRSAGGFQTHGLTGLNYQVNGEQWAGRQHAWGGGEDWGFRVGYAHRTGSDYRTGAGTELPSSYHSRELVCSLGLDLAPDRQLELSYLRLDQTNVEFPGYAFDLDVLMSNGFEARYLVEAQPEYDRWELEFWYNQTEFAGNAQNPGKRRQFPIFNYLDYKGFTDAVAGSAGYRTSVTWGDPQSCALTVGTDLRWLRQELNEISSGLTLGPFPTPFSNVNSPIPDSRWVTPGVFAECRTPLGPGRWFTAGVRGDLTWTDIVDDPAKLAGVGTKDPQQTYAEVVGTDDYDRLLGLGSAYFVVEQEMASGWRLLAGAGWAERPPNLTELYAAQPFMFVLQNGLNTVTGDPRLQPEKLLQLDLSASWETEVCRAGLRGFQGWSWDYITFENLGVVAGPDAEQINLKYVNTASATFTGFEAWGERALQPWLSPFATASYVAATDQTRAGAGREPLPGIPPLEFRLGLRLHEPQPAARWGLELAARIADSQDRVAASLREQPTPGFTTWDLRGVWQCYESLRVVAGIENLFDRNFREHLDYRSAFGDAVLQPGRNIYVGTEAVY